MGYRSIVSIAPIGSIDATAEAVIRALSDGVGQGLMWHDAEGCIVSWNRAAERIFGRHENEVVGRLLSSLFPDSARGEVDSLTEAACAGERFERIVFEIGRPDGMPVPIALSLSPVDGRRGAVAGFVSVVEELTERVWHRRHWLRSRPGSRSGRRWLTSVAGSGTSAPIRCSGASSCTACTASSRAISTARSTGHLSCVHPDDRDRIRAQMHAPWGTATASRTATGSCAPTASADWLDVRAEPTFASSGVVVGLRGVTSRPIAESQRRPVISRTRSSRSDGPVRLGVAPPFEHPARPRSESAAWLRTATIRSWNSSDWRTARSRLDDLVEALGAGPRAEHVSGGEHDQHATRLLAADDSASIWMLTVTSG